MLAVAFVSTFVEPKSRDFTQVWPMKKAHQIVTANLEWRKCNPKMNLHQQVRFYGTLRKVLEDVEKKQLSDVVAH